LGSFFEEKEEVCTPSTLGECPITLAKELLAPFCPPAAGKKNKLENVKHKKFNFGGRGGKYILSIGTGLPLIGTPL
jgi:hypothetical protein